MQKCTRILMKLQFMIPEIIQRDYEIPLAVSKISDCVRPLHAYIYFCTGFCYIWKVLKKATAELNIHQENFCNSSKIRKSCKTFLSLNLQYSYLAI